MALKLKKQGGFTLIELLIVITIIGILAVTLVPRLTGGQERARDASRKADLQQYATALEFFADDDATGSYPTTLGCLSGMSGDLGSYLTTLPTDPRGDSVDSDCGTGYIYFPLNSGDGYLLIAAVEGEAGGDGLYEASEYGTILSDSSDASTNLSALTDCASGDCMYIVGR